jgi:MFS-type transporter involved in bile tolerance (Atg22 family)
LQLIVTAAKTDRFGWLLYDFANNSFSVMIVTFAYPAYLKSVVCAGLGNLGDLLWGVNGVVSHLSGSQRLAMLAVGLLFILGLALLMRVEEPSPGRIAWS